MSPGECFAFRGQGYFVIGLSRRIEPSEFVLEHIPRNLTPTAVIDSAPRNFTVLVSRLMLLPRAGEPMYRSQECCMSIL